ncbi:MAG: N-acyl homoserine lactonase family protein [Solirubrobacteraceae bacterium]|nr:N-acyl homoserine lactonase family protein [Solirubrobacteraceae bacterium]
MPVAAEPKPFAHPLPGGSPGATVRVRPLLTGEILAPPAFWARPSGPLAVPRGFLGRRSGWIPCPIPAFLVDHPTAGPILVDTGLHGSAATDPTDSLGPVLGRVLDVRMRPEQALPAQLEALGIDPREVAAVVMTHLHYDHAGGIAQFPQATFVVSAAEWAAASRHGLSKGYRARQFDHAVDWRTVDYEHPDVGSFATFGRAVDLLGDGSVRLVFTPGHTPGHQSVVVRLHDRELLLAGDAVHRREAIAGGELPLLCEDDHLYRRTVGEIRAYLERTPGAIVIPSHDAGLWPTLDAVYS